MDYHDHDFVKTVFCLITTLMYVHKVIGIIFLIKA